MALKIDLHPFGMAREEEQLAEILKISGFKEKGATVLFPEYGAYTLEGSKRAYAKLSQLASQKKITLITTLNLPADDLPKADSKVNHNALFVFSANGRVHCPQAKITPQSFEINHLDESFPKMNVTPYDYLNRVTVSQNGREYSVFFVLCSDLYVLQLLSLERLKADALLCPANFGNGAEGAAAEVIDRLVQSQVFDRGFLCNTYQKTKKGKIPYTIGVEQVFKRKQAPVLKGPKNSVGELIKNCSVVYPDDGYVNFGAMLSFTRTGRFTVPSSRSVENGLQVRLGVYENVIELS